MGQILPPFPDVQTTLACLLTAKLELADGTLLPANHAGDQRPADLKGAMPFVEAFRFGGGDDGVTDYPEVTVNIYAPRYAVGEPLARAVRALILATPHSVTCPTGLVTVDDAETTAGPIEVAYGDAAVRMWTASYRLALRRQFSLLVA